MRHTPSSFYVRGYWAPTPTSPPSPGQYIYQTRSRGQLVETLQSFVYLLGDRKQFSGQCVWETLQHICLSFGGSRMKSVGNTGICVSSQGQLSDAFSGQVWEKHCKHMSLLGSDVSLLGSRTLPRVKCGKDTLNMCLFWALGHVLGSESRSTYDTMRGHWIKPKQRNPSHQYVSQS